MDDINSDWQVVYATGGETSSKPAVPGLLRLPPEIRAQIYPHVLGGNVVSYPRASPRPTRTHATYSTPRGPSISRESHLHGAALSAPGPARKHLLALLLTSRLLYSEALPTLYASNTFHISAASLFTDPGTSAATAHLPRIRSLRLSTADLPAAAAFLRATPRPVLARITRLRLDCCGRPGPAARAHIPHGAHWRELCAAVAEMRGLVALEVWVCGAAVPLGWQRAVLAPLREVQGVPDFCVFVPWAEEGVVAHRGGEAPFRIARYSAEEAGGFVL